LFVTDGQDSDILSFAGFLNKGLTRAGSRLSLADKDTIMAETPPNIPPGAVLPPKKETGKVQPKKETVRINLPPKPSAAPTIKLPTLPPGGPTGAPSAMPAPAPQPAARAVAASAAPVSQARPATAAPRPMPAAPTLSGLDQMLAIAAGVAGLFAVGTVIWMMLIPTN
jgi:hypothetical protein